MTAWNSFSTASPLGITSEGDQLHRGRRPTRFHAYVSRPTGGCQRGRHCRRASHARLG